MKTEKQERKKINDIIYFNNTKKINKNIFLSTKKKKNIYQKTYKTFIQRYHWRQPIRSYMNIYYSIMKKRIYGFPMNDYRKLVQKD